MPTSSSTRQRNERPRLPEREGARRDEREVTSDLDTIVWGAKAIGKLINRNERQAYHLLESGSLEGARKLGGIWSAQRSVLLAQWQGGEQ